MPLSRGDEESGVRSSPSFDRFSEKSPFRKFPDLNFRRYGGPACDHGSASRWSHRRPPGKKMFQTTAFFPHHHATLRLTGRRLGQTAKDRRPRVSEDGVAATIIGKSGCHRRPIARSKTQLCARAHNWPQTCFQLAGHPFWRPYPIHRATFRAGSGVAAPVRRTGAAGPTAVPSRPARCARHLCSIDPNKRRTTHVQVSWSTAISDPSAAPGRADRTRAGPSPSSWQWEGRPCGRRTRENRGTVGCQRSRVWGWGWPARFGPAASWSRKPREKLGARGRGGLIRPPAETSITPFRSLGGGTSRTG